MNQQEENRLPHHSGFEIPEGYFEELQKDIEWRVNEKVTKERRLVPTWTIIAIAASVLLFTGIWWLQNKLSSTELTEHQLTAEMILESGELDEYDLQQNDDLMMALHSSELPIENEISDRAIEDYLLQQDVSEYEIYNYLKNN